MPRAGQCQCKEPAFYYISINFNMTSSILRFAVCSMSKYSINHDLHKLTTSQYALC